MEEFIYPKKEEWKALLARPTASYEALEPLVSEVFTRVQEEGDKAVAAYTKQFDKNSIDNIAVSENEIIEEILSLCVCQDSGSASCLQCSCFSGTYCLVWCLL